MDEAGSPLFCFTSRSGKQNVLRAYSLGAVSSQLLIPVKLVPVEKQIPFGNDKSWGLVGAGLGEFLELGVGEGEVGGGEQGLELVGAGG